ncbi:hypothetical protein FOZ62_024358, partial [Perkinsus olseni]
YTLGVCMDTAGEAAALVEGIASRLVGIRHRRSGGRLRDIILAPTSTSSRVGPPINPKLGGLWSRLSYGREQQPSRDEYPTACEPPPSDSPLERDGKPVLLRPISDTPRVAAPAKPLPVAVVTRLISWSPPSSTAPETALLRVSASQQTEAPLLMDVLCYAPMRRETVAVGQLDMAEVCRRVSEDLGFSEDIDRLPQLAKAAIKGLCFRAVVLWIEGD